MIYLDHAATSHPKPPEVLAAMDDWYANQGVSAMRGDSDLCAQVAGQVDAVRHRLAQMCGLPTHRLAFTSGATESLNLFLTGFLEPGHRVLTTALEHSSLTRPLVHLRESLGLEIEVLDPDAEGRVVPEQIAAALDRDEFELLAFSHASNVLGSVLDAAAICQLARQRGCTTLVDSSQTAGLCDLHTGADAIVGSAHKSLLGPPGLGFLGVSPDVQLRLTRFGGTGSSRALDRQPAEWPMAMEAGTPNTPAILGLGAALEFLEQRGRETILHAGVAAIDLLRASLLEQFGERVELHGPAAGARIPIQSFNVAGLDPAEIGLLLDSAGIHVRSGFHCAPWLHERLGTAEAGTVRVSVGPFNHASDIRAVPRALTCA